MYNMFVYLVGDFLTGISNLATNAYNNAVIANDDATATNADRIAVAADKATVAADKATVSGYKNDAQGYASSASSSASDAASAAAAVKSTSTTSLAIGTGSKTLTTQSGKQYAAGMFILVTSDADPTNYMHGQVTSYATTSLVVNVLDIGGSGTLADWTISVSGSQGPTGATGSTESSAHLSGNTTIYVTQAINYTLTDYDAFTTYTVSATAGTVSITGDTISYTAPGTAQSVTLTVNAGAVARNITLTILAAGVATPTNSSPSNGATNQSGSVTLSASAFSYLGISDTHASSDWQVATDSGFTSVVKSSTTDTTNKTSWTATGLSTSQTYYWRVRYNGTSNGASSWSAAFSFTTASVFAGLIGTQGAQGFGVGIYPTTLPSGFSNMTSNTDPANANYGNYQYSDGSIEVFVPRFYYRIGNAASPRYATYGANAIDIVGVDTYATESAANTAGYAMHRAFKDGGSDKSGFFIDKYLASPNSTTSCKSIANGVPISLTTSATYTRSATQTGCTGIYADAVVLARSRGSAFNCASAFMYSALALLSLAHAQASSATTYCAWYSSGSTNFPKGCNSGALADNDDAGVTYTTAGDSGSSAKPLTGSGSPFAKTTHNGQSCGVADLNGCLYQTVLGVTNPGTSGTDTTQQANGDAYVLKSSVALSSLTGGWDGTNDAWGGSTHLATLYDSVSGLFPWGSTTGWTYFGNGSNNVFSGATSGTSWLRTGLGVQDATSGTSAGGTAQFGVDGCYQYNRANLFARSAGYWNSAASAGVFCRTWAYYRSNDTYYVGFRAGAYGD